RARDNRLVHFSPVAPGVRSARQGLCPPGTPRTPVAPSPRWPGTPRDAGLDPRPGDLVTTVVTKAAPHYLIADGAPLAVRRTRGGDAWAVRAGDQGPTGSPVMLGMPTLSALP